MIKSTTKTLHQPLTTGSCNAAPAFAPLRTGIVHSNEPGGHRIASRRLLQLRAQLSSDTEAVAAILATAPETRAPWLAVLAARCEQAGRLPEGGAPLQLVSGLDGAAGWVETAFPSASLQPKGQGTLERELSEVTVEQARATPILLRIVAAARRASQWRTDPLPPLVEVDASGQRPDRCTGQLVGRGRRRAVAG